MAGSQVKGERRLYDAIDGLIAGISDFRQRWRRNIEIRLRRQREWMDSRGRDSWPKLTDTYLERKTKDPNAVFLEVLQLTGHLYRSLTQSKAEDSVIEEHGSRLVMGTSDPKGRWHHEGRGRQPVREVIAIDDDERREHKEALYESVLDVARTEGFRVAA